MHISLHFLESGLGESLLSPDRIEVQFLKKVTYFDISIAYLREYITGSNKLKEIKSNISEVF